MENHAVIFCRYGYKSVLWKNERRRICIIGEWQTSRSNTRKSESDELDQSEAIKNYGDDIINLQRKKLRVRKMNESGKIWKRYKIWWPWLLVKWARKFIMPLLDKKQGIADSLCKAGKATRWNRGRPSGKYENVQASK